MTCCFVPSEINSIITNRRARRGEYPLGVSFVKSKNKFVATLSIGGKNKTLGHFTNPDDAFNCYKNAKEAQIKAVADNWKNALDNDVYEAIVNYKISKYD